MDEWDKVKKICKFLQVFYEATCTFFGTKYTIANLYILQIFLVKHALMIEMKNIDGFLSLMTTQLNTKFEKYWVEYNVILAIVDVLDPRYKIQFVEFSYRILYDKSLESALVKEKLFLLFEE